MKRILIFGNSGSGKSTLAKVYAEKLNVPSLDLDSIAWKSSAVREIESVSIQKMDDFIHANAGWVIEGCYSGLIAHASAYASEMIFLNPGIDACIENCRSRPWEPHKYESKEAQDRNLDFLIGWIRDYETRTDEFSLPAHKELLHSFSGKKTEIKTREDTLALTAGLLRP